MYNEDIDGLYKSVTTRLISRTARLSILCLAEGASYNTAAQSGRPSWLPSLHEQPQRFVVWRHLPKPDIQPQEGSGEVTWSYFDNHNASQPLTAKNVTFDQNLLQLNGLHLDIVVWISEIFEADLGQENRDISLISLFEDVLQDLNVSKVIWDASYILEFVQAVTTGRRESKNSTDVEVLRNFWTYMARVYQDSGMSYTWNWLEAPPGNCWPSLSYPSAIELDVVHNIIFVTQTGHVGSGTRYMKQDDHVYVLYGGAPLYILQPQGKAQEYTYVGGAYIESFVRGEAITLCEEGVLKEQRITLI